MQPSGTQTSHFRIAGLFSCLVICQFEAETIISLDFERHFKLTKHPRKFAFYRIFQLALVVAKRSRAVIEEKITFCNVLKYDTVRRRKMTSHQLETGKWRHFLYSAFDTGVLQPVCATFILSLSFVFRLEYAFKFSCVSLFSTSFVQSQRHLCT